MMTTNDPAIWKQAWIYRDHGRKLENGDHKKGSGYRMVHDTIGTNWRLTEMQSAIGLSMSCRVGYYVTQRREIAAELNCALSAIPALRLTLPPPDIEHAYYRYYVFVRPERLREGWSRDRILAAINAEGVPCFSGSCPEIYREKAFEEYRPARPFTVARELGETSWCSWYILRSKILTFLMQLMLCKR